MATCSGGFWLFMLYTPFLSTRNSPSLYRRIRLHSKTMYIFREDALNTTSRWENGQKGVCGDELPRGLARLLRVKLQLSEIRQRYQKASEESASWRREEEREEERKDRFTNENMKRRNSTKREITIRAHSKRETHGFLAWHDTTGRARGYQLSPTFIKVISLSCLNLTDVPLY